MRSWHTRWARQPRHWIVVRVAPRISPRLLAALAAIDDERVSIAEISRRLGAEAERLGVKRPSYESVRVLVHELRRRRRDPSTAEVIVDVACRLRPPTALLDHVAGIELPPIAAPARPR